VYLMVAILTLLLLLMILTIKSYCITSNHRC
jgi:hypothetical protein